MRVNYKLNFPRKIELRKSHEAYKLRMDSEVLILDCWKFFPTEVIEAIIEFLFHIQGEDYNLISCVDLWKLGLISKKFRDRVIGIFNFLVGFNLKSSFLDELHGKRYRLFHQCWLLRMGYLHPKCSQNRKSLHRLLMGGIEKKFPKQYFVNLAIPGYTLLGNQKYPDIFNMINRIDELKRVKNKIILRPFNRDQLDFFRSYYYFINQIHYHLSSFSFMKNGQIVKYESELMSNLNRIVSNFFISNFHEYVSYNSAVEI